jgi:hypothetical protein
MTALSKCCAAPLKVAGGKEGTNWYECEKCGNTPSEVAEHQRERAPYQIVEWLTILADAEQELGNPSLANEYRAIASAIETRYQTLKRMGEK